MIKICNKCNKGLVLDMFNKRRAECKTCQKIVDKQWKLNNIKQHKEVQKQYRTKHANLYSEYNKQYRLNNKEQIQITQKEILNSIPPGVYMVKNLITGEIYIGQSIKPYQRRIQHFSIHSNPNTKYTVKQLQLAMKQYSPKSFVFGIIEHCEPEQLLEREKYYIDLYQPQYNLAT